MMVEMPLHGSNNLEYRSILSDLQPVTFFSNYFQSVIETTEATLQKKSHRPKESLPPFF